MQCKRINAITEENTVLEAIIFADIKTIGNKWGKNLGFGFLFCYFPVQTISDLKMRHSILSEINIGKT